MYQGCHASSKIHKSTPFEKSPEDIAFISKQPSKVLIFHSCIVCQIFSKHGGQFRFNYNTMRH